MKKVFFATWTVTGLSALVLGCGDTPKGGADSDLTVSSGGNTLTVAAGTFDVNTSASIRSIDRTADTVSSTAATVVEGATLEIPEGTEVYAAATVTLGTPAAVSKDISLSLEVSSSLSSQVVKAATTGAETHCIIDGVDSSYIRNVTKSTIISGTSAQLSLAAGLFEAAGKLRKLFCFIIPAVPVTFTLGGTVVVTGGTGF